MNIFIAELLGTMLLISFGCGVVANVCLAKSGMKGGGSVQITLAWAAGVALPAIIFGGVSGAHLNPAVSVVMCLNGVITVSELFVYIAAQMIGAILGSCLVFLMFKKHFDTETDPGVLKGVFCTAPAIRAPKWNFITEMITTFFLLFALLNFPSEPAVPGTAGLHVFILIMALGMSFGGVTGYAINPARDLGPRIAHAFLPIPHKGDSDWSYAWVPVLGPVVGGVLAFALTKVILPSLA